MGGVGRHDGNGVDLRPIEQIREVRVVLLDLVLLRKGGGPAGSDVADRHHFAVFDFLVFLGMGVAHAPGADNCDANHRRERVLAFYRAKCKR